MIHKYLDVVSEVSNYLAHQRDLLVQAGVEQERICLDPGIGFGKKHLHNRQLLQQTHQLHRLQQPILIGHSRKGFIAKELGDPEFDRLYGNLGVSLAMAQQRVQLLRVHDILPVAQALKLFEFAGGTAAIC